MVTISRSLSKAEIEEKGAYLKSLVIDGQEVIKRPVDESPTHGGSAVLIPYAGRVRNASYTYNGRLYELPRNNGSNSIHGFLKDEVWSSNHQKSDSVTFSCDFSHSGYPSMIHTEIEYVIRSGGLEVNTSVKNTGDERIPLLIGFHPYFLTGGEWRLSHTEKIRQLNFEDGYFPDGTYRKVDFNRLKNMQDMEFDNCFEGGGVVTLVRKGSSITIRRTNMPYLVIYNGTYSEGLSVAIEPMTGAPNAFNNGIGLIEVDPGKEFTCGFSVETIV